MLAPYRQRRSNRVSAPGTVGERRDGRPLSREPPIGASSIQLSSSFTGNENRMPDRNLAPLFVVSDNNGLGQGWRVRHDSAPSPIDQLLMVAIKWSSRFSQLRRSSWVALLLYWIESRGRK